jgi:hypothetical protein
MIALGLYSRTRNDHGRRHAGRRLWSVRQTNLVGVWSGSFMCQSTPVMKARRERDQLRPRSGSSFLGEDVEGKAPLRLETFPVKSRGSAEGIGISETTRLTSVHVRDGARKGCAPSAGPWGRGWPGAQITGARPSVPVQPATTPDDRWPGRRRA